MEQTSTAWSTAVSKARDGRERSSSDGGEQAFGFGFGPDDPAEQPASPEQQRRRRWPWFVGSAAALVAVLGAVGLLVPDSTTAAPPKSSPTARMTPAASATVFPNPTPTPGPGTALAALAALTVKGKAAATGYEREEFGTAWADVDGNGCDTRDDILARDLTDTVLDGTCEVASGTLVSPYTAVSMHFVRGWETSAEVQIDHVVPLANAWRTGAYAWSATQREAFANDPLNLFAVDGPSNQQKSDGDAATWLPANKSFRCLYVAHQVAVKAKYRLSVAPAERDAIARVLAACPTQTVPTESSIDVRSVVPTSTASPSAEQARAEADRKAKAEAAAATAAQEKAAADAAAAQAAADAAAQQAATDAAAQQEAPAAPAAGTAFYANCDAVRAAGAAPIRVGDPGYSRKLDRDGDGVGCE
jgi:chemotaxis protein histidine kinase CheA